ncbi:MAG: hypothetical protein IJ586_00220 [Alloprevotella sp.]|nr:hypothetical protein [Alloprevotella sp.]
MNLLDLAVKITTDDQASSKVASVSEGIKSKLGAAAKVGAAAMGAVSVAAGAAGAKLVGAANDVASYGDNIDKMSQKMGLSAKAYQEWDAVMQHSGTSMETMKASMKTLANAAESGNEAFQRLGMTQEQVASMSQEELFEATIAGLQGVSDTTERTYLAGQLLGRGATELGALLNTSAEDTQAMRDRVNELGGVMSDEAVKAAAAYQDSMQDMQTAMSGLKNNMMGEFLPSITTVMDGLQEVFTGNYDEGLVLIGEGVSGVVENVSEVIPKVAEIGGGIINALGTAVSENLPQMLDAVILLVTQIAQALIDNIPTIVGAIVGAIPTLLNAGIELFLSLLDAIVVATPQIIDGLVAAILTLIDKLPQYLPQMLSAAGQFIMAIATAIAEHLPEIVDALVGMVGQLVDYVVTHGPEMLSAAGEFIAGMAQAIGEALPDVIAKIGELAMGAIDGIGGFVGEMVTAGVNFITGFIDGIGQAAGQVVESAIGAVSGAVDGVLEFLGIKSPSRLMRRLGGFTMEGFAKGISDSAWRAERAMTRAAEGVYAAASGSVSFGVAAGVPFGGTVNNYYIDGMQYLPGTAIAEAVAVVFEVAVEETRR